MHLSHFPPLKRLPLFPFFFKKQLHQSSDGQSFSSPHFLDPLPSRKYVEVQKSADFLTALKPLNVVPLVGDKVGRLADGKRFVAFHDSDQSFVHDRHLNL